MTFSRSSFWVHGPLLCVLSSLIAAAFLIPTAQNYEEFNVGRVNPVHHLPELGALLLAGLGFVSKAPKWNTLASAFILIYGLAMLLVPFSKIPIMTAYLSSKGLLYCALGILLGWAISRYPEKERINKLCVVLGLIFYLGTLSYLIRDTRNFGLDGVLFRGYQGGTFTLIGGVYLFAVSKSGFRKARIPEFLIAMSLIYFANTLATMLSLLGALLVCLVAQRKFLAVGIICLSGILIAYLVYSYIGIYNIRLANKGYFELVTASGRFEVYLAVLRGYLEGSIPLLGVGLGADRAYLLQVSDLPWFHTSHNSLLSLILGFGHLGILIYLTFVGVLVAQLLNLRYSNRKNAIFLFSATSFLLYGLTAPTFPGFPGFLITVAVALSMLIDRQPSVKHMYSSNPASHELNPEALRD